MARYRFVDYLTQLYLAGIGLLLAACHNERVPQWPTLLAVNALGLVAVHWLVVAHARRPGSRVLDAMRHLYPMAVYVVLYCEACLLDLMFVERYLDGAFLRLEERLFGCQPCVEWMARAPCVAVSELLYGAYASFYVTVLGMGIVLHVRDRSRCLHYVSVTSFVFYACFLAFIFLPVAGPPMFWMEGPGFAAAHGVPYLAMEFPAAVQRGPLYTAMRFLYGQFQVQGGAFPSSHIAAALCTLTFSWRYLRRFRLIHLVLVVLLSVSTVYCRYHYAVDVLGGAAAAALLVPLGEWLYRRVGTTRG
jgi:membrane-associated phospholipid phosphatase